MKLFTLCVRQKNFAAYARLLVLSALMLLNIADLQAQTYTFTNAGATGNTGPTQALANTAYTNTSLSGKVTVTGGKQKWTVPSSGAYSIKGLGASGGDIPTYTKTGGLGASIYGEFYLLQGDVIEILVGQKGQDGCGGGGGGGGTYVLRNGSIILVAGGGGGATSDNNGANGVTTTSGTNDFPGGSTAGGTNGGGGLVCNVAGANHGGGGGGYSGNGLTSTAPTPGAGGLSYTNGGTGGGGTAAVGGFGGGGGATSCTVGGGGGGGYSGGAGGQQVNYCTSGINRSGGGGGGSYNIGIGAANIAGANKGDGKVIIELQTTGKPDDVATYSILAPTVFCQGTQTVKAIIRNVGSNKVTSLKVNWSVDGTSQTQYSYSKTLDTFGGAGGSLDTVTLGTINFNSGATKAIKVWTSNPNGNSDPNTSNDTATTTRTPALNGIYTIGASGNFTNFTSAVTALNTLGVCGPVTFNVQAGTYSERFTLNEISGASATNRISFIGAGKGSTIITSTGTSTANMQTITLNGADYVTIKDMTVENKGASFGVAIHLTNNASYNVIEGCEILLSTTTTTATVGGIIANGSLTVLTTAGNSSNYTIVRNNTITGGYYPLLFAGAGTGAGQYIMGNEILNNTISSSYHHGLYLIAMGETKVIGNKVSGVRNTTGYGAYFYQQNNFIFERNNLTAQYYGIYSYYLNYYNYNASGTKSVIANNMINSTAYYGFYSVYPYYTSINYNSVRGNGTYGGYISSALSTNLVGNIFVNTTANYALYLASGTFGTIDYNIYYAPTAANLAYQGAAYSSLIAWQTAQPTFNKNSLQQNPGFISNADLHLDNFGPKPIGPNLGYDKDVDGDARCEFAPTIGADESIIGKGLIKVQAGIFPPTAIYTNTPAVFEGKQIQGALQKNHWYLDGVFMKDTMDYVHTFTATGTHTLKVVTIGCGSTDTAETTITVTTQSKAPVADFAMETTVAQGDVLRFMDLSENGPETWKWEITPDIYYDINNQQQPRYKFMSGDANSFNPAVRFDQTGRYRVCLTVTNAFGTDAECRTNYITVVPRVNLGSGTVTTESTGYLYDDGGIDGNYSNGQLKGMLIKPCASEVFMVFNSFKLDCQDDFVRVYDGADNKAPALHPCLNNIGNGGGPGLTGPGCALACTPSLNDTFIAKSGMMYVEFYSSANNNAPGFEAHWWSTPANVSAPLAYFEAPDSICVGSIVTFYNKSQGQHVKVQWELDGDDKVFESEDTVSAEWAFVIPGTASIKLIAENCGGTDTIVKSFVVYQPSAPTISFMADNLNPATTDDVTFTSTIKGCVDKYKWVFTKVNGTGTFTQLEGTTLASAVTKVMFHDTGLWTVELWAENVTGDNTLVKTAYVKVKEAYCTPTVGTIISDVGISKVVFNTITNTTAQGLTSYSNYVSTKKTNVEIGATYDLEVSRTSNVNNISWAAWIDWNQDGDFEDFQEKVGSLTNSNGKSWKLPITIPVLAKEGPSVMRIGVSRGTGANTPCGQNNYGEFEDYRVIVTLDRTKPVITLSGNADMIIEQGRKYTEPGYAAEDNLDGTITHKVKADTYIVATNQLVTTLNTFVVRDYEIRYRVQDDAGNTGTAVRTVRVIADTTAPELTIGNDVNLSVDVAAGSYTTPAVTKAEDNIDGIFTTQVMKVTTIDPQMVNVVQIIDPVDPAKVGVYTVTYYASDVLGNATTITRKVTIFDDKLPVLNIVGANPVKHQIGEPYNDMGVTPSDNYYKLSDLEPLIITTSNVNVNKFGTYTVMYRLTDPSGNGPVTTTRQVIVTDTIKPEISLIGSANVVTEVNKLFIDQGVKVADNYGLKGNWKAAGSFYTKFPNAIPNELGTFTISYSVEDLAGNIVTIDRTVEVKDRTAPVVALKGNASINICRWSAYTDSGYTVSDNFDAEGDLKVTTEGTWLTEGKVTGLNGTYSLRYIIEDKSKNMAYSQTRTINVLHETDFRCKSNGIEEKAVLEQHVSVYPNPTNGRLTVKLNLEEMKQVRLSVVNMMGQEIANVAEGQIQEGIWTVDLSAQASGVYFLRVVSDNTSFSKQVVLTK